MTDFKKLPDNDPDLILAREYGKVLDGEQEITDITNPMFKKLVDTRNAANLSEAEIPIGDTEITWDRIQKAISDNEAQNKSNILPLFSAKKWYWAVAAVILITISTMFLLRQFVETDPQLLAEAGSSISFIELSDGSSVTLRPNSSLYVIDSSDKLQSYLLRGEALFDVESHPDRAFSVEAGYGRVVVTGTRFNLSDRDERSTVHLLEGSVMFETANKARSIRLIPGKAAVISSDKKIEEPFKFEPDEVTGWTESRLLFRDRPVADILSELEFHYNIAIKASDEINQITLGGSIALENAEQSLQDLGIVLGGEFVQTDERTYQFRNIP